MGKLITLVIIVAVIYFFILPKFRKKDSQNDVQNFVQCEICGTFVSLDETTIQNNKYICKECLKEQKCK